MTTNAEYHADPAISASHLHAVAASPYHYWKRYLDPSRRTVEPTAAMRLGSLVHCAVLEPDELMQRYGVCGPRNTKAGKEQAAATPTSAGSTSRASKSRATTAARKRWSTSLPMVSFLSRSPKPPDFRAPKLPRH